MDYDILILGGGIIGCSVAYELSKYNFNIAVIEKDYDIADDISFVNTSVVYDGSETSDNIMAGLEYIGNLILEDTCKKFNVPFKNIGALRVVNDENGVKKLEEMYARAKNRGIDGVRLIDSEEVYSIEPNINTNIKKGLYSENVAIVAPYDLAIAYAEVASDNGVNFRLEEEVLNIQNLSKGFKVTTNKNKFSCKVVINTIPNEIYIQENGIVEEKNSEVSENEFKNMSYLLVADNYKNKLNKIVIETLDKNTFVLSTPTTTTGSLIGIKSTEKTSLDDNLDYVNNLLIGLDKSNINNLFRESYDKDSILIDDSEIKRGYIRVTGTHYGKITMAPAIAKMLCDTLTNNLKCTLKKNFLDKRRYFYKFREMDREELNEVIALDERYGKIVCVCNNISEGEIVDCIRRPLGARTVEGVKRRTGAGFGSCHGSYCYEKIINILARELDKKVTDIVDDSKESKIISSRIKEFDGV
ncbi:NAD(P)/FAD-dependent oxidoreductase [Clostridium chauvoei]|uniref:FAD-dependent oxidoreductase n=2 Tax=Clostridium chauvoei TaxID=46867 RepID=A0ABD4RJA4_9CLOT|nr:FAD-dependent oxidoreductase [Clostridium chauvoei]ATD53758.1 FAD/NAD(P)-binding oxidoreductase [Clostridium chauvoei]ATD56279.1 FAD/NAD(P)-binding oxidoreductase [Clostridium chauvoei]MBX7281450.1 FAD-dependent oxidoreductase [Clostridium chauvoei]MBX7283992.1 FAD-dependent oxidoreductase [Clostridium chauvoei]MBX7286498.1 FAD-dependent oxidoreductase [Clostridium chauvoei]